MPGCTFIGPTFVNVATDGFLWHGNQTQVCVEGRFLAKRKEAVKLGLPSADIAFGSLVIKIRVRRTTMERVDAGLWKISKNMGFDLGEVNFRDHNFC